MEDKQIEPMPDMIRYLEEYAYSGDVRSYALCKTEALSLVRMWAQREEAIKQRDALTAEIATLRADVAERDERIRELEDLLRLSKSSYDTLNADYQQQAARARKAEETLKEMAEAFSEVLNGWFTKNISGETLNKSQAILSRYDAAKGAEMTEELRSRPYAYGPAELADPVNSYIDSLLGLLGRYRESCKISHGYRGLHFRCSICRAYDALVDPPKTDKGSTE